MARSLSAGRVSRGPQTAKNVLTNRAFVAVPEEDSADDVNIGSSYGPKKSQPVGREGESRDTG